MFRCWQIHNILNILNQPTAEKRPFFKHPKSYTPSYFVRASVKLSGCFWTQVWFKLKIGWSEIISQLNKCTLIESTITRESLLLVERPIFHLTMSCMLQCITNIQSVLQGRRNLGFIYSEKTTKFCEIFTLLLTGTT